MGTVEIDTKTKSMTVIKLHQFPEMLFENFDLVEAVFEGVVRSVRAIDINVGDTIRFQVKEQLTLYFTVESTDCVNVERCSG